MDALAPSGRCVVKSLRDVSGDVLLLNIRRRGRHYDGNSPLGGNKYVVGRRVSFRRAGNFRLLRADAWCGRCWWWVSWRRGWLEGVAGGGGWWGEMFGFGGWLYVADGGMGHVGTTTRGVLLFLVADWFGTSVPGARSGGPPPTRSAGAWQQALCWRVWLDNWRRSTVCVSIPERRRRIRHGAVL
jgi:hypothetical protein